MADATTIKPIQPPVNDPLAQYTGRTLTSQEAAQAAQAAGMTPNAGGDYFSNVNNGQKVGNSNYTWQNAGQGWTLQGGTTPPPTTTTTGPTTPPPTTTATPPPITTATDVLNGTTTPNAPTTGPTTVAQSYQQGLVNLLNPQAVSASSPSIQPAIQANALAEQRGVEQQQNALAEQAAASGTSMSGGNDALQRGILADSASRQGQYAGGLLQHASDLQNQDLLAALGLGGNALQSGQQNSQFLQNLTEQARQANQTNATQNLGINTQGSLGTQDINLRGRLGDQQSNLGLLQALLGNQQFNNSLNQNANEFGLTNDSNNFANLLRSFGVG